MNFHLKNPVPAGDFVTSTGISGMLQTPRVKLNNELIKKNFE